MYDAMKDGSIDGMQTFDLELEKMIRQGSITRENGLLYASNSNIWRSRSATSTERGQRRRKLSLRRCLSPPKPHRQTRFRRSKASNVDQISAFPETRGLTRFRCLGRTG